MSDDQNQENAEQTEEGYNRTEDPCDTLIQFHLPYGSEEGTIRLEGELDKMARGLLSVMHRVGEVAQAEGVIGGANELDGASAALMLVREVVKHEQQVVEAGDSVH